MKKMRKLGALLLLITIAACESTAVDESRQVQFVLTGDMLFSGANTLQASADVDLAAMAQEMGTEPGQFKNIGVSQARLSMKPEDAAITESLLLQIVSNNNGLTTLGTLSPVTDGTEFELRLAEEIDLLPYLRDEGATWVLDLNLDEDHMEAIEVPANLKLTVNYIE